MGKINWGTTASILGSTAPRIGQDIKNKLAKNKVADTSKPSSSSDSGPQSEGATGGNLDSYHKGGKVRKTGIARLKKGERVLTKSQQKKYLKKR